MRFAHQGVVLDRFPDQAPFLGVSGRERLRQQGEASGSPRSRQAGGGERGPEVGHQSNAREGLDETRRARRQNNVAGQCEIGAGAGGDAIDGADDRHGKGAHSANERIAPAFETCAEIGRRSVRRGQTLAEVLPRAKPAPSAGQKHSAAGLVAPRRGERGVERADQRADKGIELLRAIQCDDVIVRVGRDFAYFDENGTFFHRVALNQEQQPGQIIALTRPVGALFLRRRRAHAGRSRHSTWQRCQVRLNSRDTGRTSRLGQRAFEASSYSRSAMREWARTPPARTAAATDAAEARDRRLQPGGLLTLADAAVGPRRPTAPTLSECNGAVRRLVCNVIAGPREGPATLTVLARSIAISVARWSFGMDAAARAIKSLLS